MKLFSFSTWFKGPSLLDFLAEPRTHTRSRQAIDEALAEDRGAWGER